MLAFINRSPIKAANVNFTQHTKMVKRKFRRTQHPQRPEESPADYDIRMLAEQITFEESECCLRPCKFAACVESSCAPVAGVSGGVQKIRREEGMPPESVSSVLREWFECASRVLRVCFESALSVLRVCFKSASRVVRDCFESASRVFRACFESGSSVLRECFESALRVLCLGLLQLQLQLRTCC